MQSLFAICRAQHVLSGASQQFMTREENSCLVINRQDYGLPFLYPRRRESSPCNDWRAIRIPHWD